MVQADYSQTVEENAKTLEYFGLIANEQQPLLHLRRIHEFLQEFEKITSEPDWLARPKPSADKSEQ